MERFGEYVLSRPDPQIVWKKSLPESEWQKASGVYDRDWGVKNMPRQWQVDWEGLQLELRLTPFKHVGIFPEQREEWTWLGQAISKSEIPNPNVLNLFGYTAVASLVCAKMEAKVTHVDGSRPTIAWARRNQELSGLAQKPIRWICDDAIKFVGREVKRGAKYDGIIMDPPVFGHGPNGEQWKFNENLPELLGLCQQVLAEKPEFVIINAYAVTTSHVTLTNVLTDMMGKFGGKVESGELQIQQDSSTRILSTGIWGRWNGLTK